MGDKPPPAQTRDRINKFVHNQQFQLALDLAEKENLSPEIVQSIYSAKAEADYIRQEYDEAVKSFIMTVGYTDPSYVISKFIEQSLNEYLIQYLEALTEKGLATKQYTTLMFSCYTKLRDAEKLHEIVKKCIKEADSDPHFDVEEACNVLYEGGFKVETLALAKAYKLYEIVIGFYLKEKRLGDTLPYLRTVPNKQLPAILKRYGGEIVESGTKKQRTELIDIIKCAALCPDEASRITILPIAHIFTNKRGDLYSLLSDIRREAPERLTKELWGTLVELALFEPFEDADEEVADLLKDPSLSCDWEHLVMLVGMSKNEVAKEIVFKDLNLIDPILRTADVDVVVGLCREYKPVDGGIWRRALRYICKRGDQKLVKDFLSHCDGNVSLMELLDVLPPPMNTVGVARGFLEAHFGRLCGETNKLVSENERSLEEVTAKENRIRDITKKMYDTHGIRCDVCNESIDLPAKYFFCGHHFHLACLGDNIGLCPVCIARHERNTKAKLRLIENADKFTVADIDDPFSDVTNRLGTALFTMDDEEKTKKEAEEFLSVFTNSC